MKTITETGYKKDEKKDLSPDEFAKAKTVCDFVIDLIKAISRSGYYDATHPVSMEVKKGLYDTFESALGTSKELMLTCHEVEDKVDIHISGILDEPFNIRKLTHATTSDLFVPKLNDYFERKNLNSFVIKKYITPEHFESFIDVMSEPIADSTDSSRLGEYLTKALADLDITEVSTIFKTDIVLSRGRLPWRVAIILRRLAKDLKVIPMFRSASADKMKLIKKQIVEDIIRPLHKSDLLRDLIINCDIIVNHITHLLEIDELETLMIHSLPQDALVPVAQDVFETYKQVKEENSAEGDSASEPRAVYLMKVLNIAAERIIFENLPNITDFFEQLYEYKIIEFNLLPENLRRDIQNKKMGGEIIAHINDYIQKYAASSTTRERENYAEKFKTVMPEFITQKKWAVINNIIKVLSDYSVKKDEVSKESILLNLPDAVFSNSEILLADEYINADQELRNQINNLLLQLKPACIKIVTIIFSKCKDSIVLKNVTELMSKKGDLARQWSIEILDNQNQSLSMLNIALLVMINVGQSSDTDSIKKYIKYPNASIRAKAVSTIARLNKNEAESFVIDALQDEEEKVRSQAVNILEHELFVSGESINKLLLFVKEKMHKKDMKLNETAIIASIIRAMGKIQNSKDKEKLESEITGIVSDLLKERKGFLKIIKSDLSRERVEILGACAVTLGKIGGKKSREYLKTLLNVDDALSKVVNEAMAELDKKSANK